MTHICTCWRRDCSEGCACACHDDDADPDPGPVIRDYERATG